MPELEIPTADELFGWARPDPEPAPIPSDSIAWELADQECARLLVNCLFDPPIVDAEIDRHARRFELSFREAEIEIREARNG